ncbi:MAG: ABC transporter permease subunit [Clostridia bacterium]|nr:ABC transporter permease subunit [Clostridia bacterium]
MKKKNERILNLILPIVTVVALILTWAVASYKVDSEYILPSISKTLAEFFDLFKSKEFYYSFILTLLRSLIAFFVSFILAFAFAVLSVKLKVLKNAILTLMSILRALPTIAIVLLLLFWTNSRVAPVIVTMLVVLPTLYTHIDSAFFSLDKTVIEAGRVDGADEKNLFFKIELPQILPSIYSGIGSGISLNFKLMVAAEVISQTANSIGYMLNTSKVYFEVARMLAIVCFAVIFGVVIEAVFNALSKRADMSK